MTYKIAQISIPDPQPVVFEHSPLALVVCQLRFEHLGLPDEAGLRVLREALSDYPLVQPHQGVEVQIGHPGAQASTRSGWRFVSLDQAWTVSLMNDSVSIETTAYKEWEDLDARLRVVLKAMDEVLKPRVEVRLGLRYVNEITRSDIEAPTDWAKYLRPEIVALTSASPLAESAFNAQQAVQVEAGNGAILTMRHGFPGAPHGGGPDDPVYLLDFDCFREGQRPLEVDEMLGEADRFNTLITSLFQWCLTEALWKELAPRAK